jgi:transposase-like protein
MPKKTGLRNPQEFKAEAVQLARSSPEKSVRQLAYELGVMDQILRNWIRQAQIDHGERELRAGRQRLSALTRQVPRLCPQPLTAW